MQSLSKKRINREKQDRPGRLEYLDLLLVEFQTSESEDAKEQILANLANFAYDPSNYNYFRELGVLDLFLDNLLVTEENLTKFSIAGLCNLCLDPINKEYIIANGLNKILNLLDHLNDEIKISVITTLMFLVTPGSKAEITSDVVVKSMLKLSKNNNTRIRNLATIFLEDYCTKEQITNILLAKNEAFPHVIASSNISTSG